MSTLVQTCVFNLWVKFSPKWWYLLSFVCQFSLVFRLGFRYFSFPKHIFSSHDIVYIVNTLKSSVEFAKISRCAMSHEKTASLSENLSF